MVVAHSLASMIAYDVPTRSSKPFLMVSFIYEPSQRHWPIIVRFHLGDQLGRESLCLCYHPARRIAKQLPLQVGRVED